MPKNNELLKALTVAVSSLKDGIPVAVVKTEGGGYEAIPQAYLTDISYQGSKDVAARYNDIADIITEGDPAKYDNGQVAQWLLDNGEW